MGYGIDTYTKLLLHCDGADGSTVFVDSATGKTVTAVNQAQIDTAQKKFGSGSALFDGTGDYLTIPDSDDWNFSTGDFTIDCWVRFNALPTSGVLQTIFWQSTATPTPYYYLCLINDSGLKWHFYSSDMTLDIRVTATVLADTWYHVALVRYGNIFRIFQDGTQCGADTTNAGTMPNIASVVSIGGYSTYSAGSSPFNGWIDEFRVSKGIARWTANFTPPTSEHSLVYNFIPKEIVKTNQHPSTALKMYHQFEGNSTDITANDHDGTDTAITYGNDYGVFNQGALFNGSTSKIVIADHADLKPTGAFSIGCWIKHSTAIGAHHAIFWSENEDGYVKIAGISLRVYSNGRIQTIIGKNTGTVAGADYNNIQSSFLINDGIWHFVVFTFNGSMMFLYIDGKLDGSTATFGPAYNATNYVRIGCGYWDGADYVFYGGSIDDLFLLNGVALTAEQIYYLYNHRSVGVMK